MTPVMIIEINRALPWDLRRELDVTSCMRLGVGVLADDDLGRLHGIGIEDAHDIAGANPAHLNQFAGANGGGRVNIETAADGCPLKAAEGQSLTIGEQYAGNAVFHPAEGLLGGIIIELEVRPIRID